MYYEYLYYNLGYLLSDYRLYIIFICLIVIDRLISLLHYLTTKLS